MPPAHSFVTCPLHSDPGPIDDAPFAEVPLSDTMAFVSMCAGTPASSLGCPPTRLQGGSGLGCASWDSGPCWKESPDMRCFFGVPPGAPAIWTTIPDLVPLNDSATR
jgi:hypothetical protein